MIGKIRFTTCGTAERDRVPFVGDFPGLDITPLADTDFDMDISVVRLDSVCVAHGWVSPLTAVLARDASADILIGICDRDVVTTDAQGQVEALKAGGVLLMPLDRAFAWTFPAGGATTAIRLDRAALAARIPGFDPVGVHCLDTGLAGAELLFSYARALHYPDEIASETAGLASRHLLDLAALVISEAGVGSAAGVKAARFLAAKRDVARRFREPGLSIHDVAARQNITPRYLQILFDQNGATFTRCLRNMRLDYARTRLRQAEAPPRILDVALEAGFTDLSTFNRLFRKRFGDTPSAFRGACTD